LLWDIYREGKGMFPARLRLLKTAGDIYPIKGFRPLKKKETVMSKITPIRNQEKDHLLTPLNSIFVFIDYQPEQFSGVTSRSRSELLLNIRTLAKTAREFGIPTVISTVGVAMGVNQGSISELTAELPGNKEIDRSTLNAWEDKDFLAAVKATGRKKIIMSGLWTEVCVAFPTLDALKDGYEVYPVVDAIGGVTLETHQQAMKRMIQAGAHPVTALALACEIQRDWARGNGDSLRGILQWYFSELRELPRAA
jgi:nicotinamidase-related amidase